MKSRGGEGKKPHPHLPIFKLGNYTSDRLSYFSPLLQFLITFVQRRDTGYQISYLSDRDLHLYSGLYPDLIKNKFSCFLAKFCFLEVSFL